MVYQNKLVAAIKVNGHILRESHGLVTLPFGSEYSVYVKNLNAVRVQVKISVDGTDATKQTWLVIEPNTAFDLERFIGDSFQVGHKFKFIERTAAVEAHRGLKADDGIVRIEYQTERVQQYVDVPIPRYYDQWVPRPHPWYPPQQPFFGNVSSGLMRSRGMSTGDSVTDYAVQVSNNLGDMKSSVTQTDTGITVAGSISHQAFRTVQGFPTTGVTDVLILQLRGEVGGKRAKAPLTVKTKLTCTSCGRTSKSGVEFCPRCGTALFSI